VLVRRNTNTTRSKWNATEIYRLFKWPSDTTHINYRLSYITVLFPTLKPQKLWKVTKTPLLASPCLSARPYTAIRERLNGFYLKLILASFIKICRHIPLLSKIGQQQQALYRKTYMRCCDQEWAGNPQAILITTIMLYAGCHGYLGYMRNPRAGKPSHRRNVVESSMITSKPSQTEARLNRP
jgi:hypothetical protein